MAERHAYPGGYKKSKAPPGICSACGKEPIAKGNRFLGDRCYRGTWDQEDKPEPDIVTKEEAIELCIRVEKKLLPPPTPVKHLSCDEYTQEELQKYLDGGGK